MAFRGETSYQKGYGFTAINMNFASHNEAMELAESRADKSSLIADYRVVEVSDEPTHQMVDGRPVRLMEFA
jgi:hypothetical protein